MLCVESGRVERVRVLAVARRRDPVLVAHAVGEDHRTRMRPDRRETNREVRGRPARALVASVAEVLVVVAVRAVAESLDLPVVRPVVLDIVRRISENIIIDAVHVVVACATVLAPGERRPFIGITRGVGLPDIVAHRKVPAGAGPTRRLMHLAGRQTEGHQFVVIAQVKRNALPQRAEIRHVCRRLGTRSGRPERGEQDPDQQRDDRDHDKEFDQRERWPGRAVCR